MTIGDPDINLLIYSHLIFNKGAQHTQWRKDSLFNKYCWENWISTCRRLKLDFCLSLYQYQLKVNHRPSYKALNFETTPGSSRKYSETGRCREPLPK
jgi:hypothetical protein